MSTVSSVRPSQPVLPHLNFVEAPATKTFSAISSWYATHKAFTLDANPQVESIGSADWRTAVATLRSGVRVEVSCVSDHTSESTTREPGFPSADRTREPHELLIHPDGTITASHHSTFNHPHGGNTAGLDLDAELVLLAIGGPKSAPPCIRVALWILAEQQYPARNFIDALGGRDEWAFRDLRNARSYYAAVAWAQYGSQFNIERTASHTATLSGGTSGDPSGDTSGDTSVIHDQPALPPWVWWPTAGWDRFCHDGITPHMLAFWVAHGWTVDSATRWLRRGVPFELANAWYQTGRTDKDSIRLASSGLHPDDERPWVVAGFEIGQSARWRLNNKWTPTPEQAYNLHLHRVQPHVAHSISGLPETTEEAEAAFAAHNKHSRPLAHKAHPDPTVDKALAWSKAGVASDVIVGWYRTVGDNLPEVLTWSPHVSSATYRQIAAWNLEHPHTPVVPEWAARWERLRFPRNAKVMGRAAACGVSADQMAGILNMMGTGKRWWGIEARAVLSAGINAKRPALEPPRNLATETRYWWHLGQTIDAGDWRSVGYLLRSQYVSGIELWGFLLDWLATNPTPPPPYVPHT